MSKLIITSSEYEYTYAAIFGSKYIDKFTIDSIPGSVPHV